MFWKRRTKSAGDNLIPVPSELPPVEGLDDHDRTRPGPIRRTWLWTLIGALAAVLLVAYVIVLGVMGVYDGLRDRTLENQRIARDHYALGSAYLEAGDYELAIAEFGLALRFDSHLDEAQVQLQEAEELAKAQATPTSETRQDAARLLYRQGVADYESGNLAQAVAVLEELRGLDADHQRENVEMMLSTAYHQLGLRAVAEDRLGDAATYFGAVLAMKPSDEKAQEQLNLVHLYTAALSYWERDWTATIQALKGLFALAPDFKDVQTRLHDAYVFLAQVHVDEGDWCRAADDYAAAVEVLPSENTVDRRDDAAIQCQATAEAPTPQPSAKALATATQPSAVGTIGPKATSATPVPTEATGPTPSPPTVDVGAGRIAFTSYDAVRRSHDIYVVDLVQGDAKLVQENGSQPALAPGGQRLAFRNLDSGHLGLGILDLRNNWIIELTNHPEDSTPTWSPDSQHIAFASNKHGDRKWRVYAISPGAVWGEGQEWAIGHAPAWSSDGRQLAYHGCDERGDNCGVWVMKAGGFVPFRLTTSATDTAPVWSSEGSQVAFISARAGNWEVYLVDVATGKEIRLTDHPAADVAPVWSPDGKRLAFLSNREGAWAVHVLEIRTGKVQRVIATGDAYPDPVSERLSWVP